MPLLTPVYIKGGRAKKIRGTLTKSAEQSIDIMLGKMQTIKFFNGMFKNISKIKCNPRQKFQELMIGLNRQELNEQLSKYRSL